MILHHMELDKIDISFIAETWINNNRSTTSNFTKQKCWIYHNFT